MKYLNSIISILLTTILFVVVGCVHDDEYATPDTSNQSYKCEDLVATITMEDLKTMYTSSGQNELQITTDEILEGYVSSSDESGNIYKNIYIQDNAVNPTQGFVLSVNSISNYTQYPKGAKIYIKLKDLYLGEYGSVIQLGDFVDGEFDRLPENKIADHIVRDCSDPVTIVPKVVTLAQLNSSFGNPLIGCLLQVDNAEFAQKNLCETFAPDGETVDKSLQDATFSGSSRLVRNSGYASFANQSLPSGNGTFVGVLSKFNSTFQFYINSASDLDMTANRLDGSLPLCTPPAPANTTIAEVKALFSGSLMQITQDLFVDGVITANDIKGNHYKYVYIEDETGGLKFKVNKRDLYQDHRFEVGNTMLISLKDLYLGEYGGETQLGGIFNGSIGNLDEDDVYKHVFKTEDSKVTPTPTEISITDITNDMVGQWVKIKDLQFIDADLGKSYSEDSFSGNRILEDCSGNTIVMRTSNFANFGDFYDPFPAATTMIDGGKGDVYAILSVFNGTYQLYINDLLGADLDNARCDGSIYVAPTNVLNETFDNGLGSFTAVSVTGAQVWESTNFGNPGPSVIMSGYDNGNFANEDWLISPVIDLSGFTNATFSVDSDTRYNGDTLEVFTTTNYTGDVATTTWTPLAVNLDPNTNSWGFSGSGDVNFDAFVGGNVVVAFKYTSTTSSGATWEIDNVKVTATN